MKQLSGQLKKDKDSALKSIALLDNEIAAATSKIQVLITLNKIHVLYMSIEASFWFRIEEDLGLVFDKSSWI